MVLMTNLVNLFIFYFCRKTPFSISKYQIAFLVFCLLAVTSSIFVPQKIKIENDEYIKILFSKKRILFLIWNYTRVIKICRSCFRYKCSYLKKICFHSHASYPKFGDSNKRFLVINTQYSTYFLTVSKYIIQNLNILLLFF